MAIDGDRVIVGAQFQGPVWEGAAYVFERDGPVWSQEAKLKSSRTEPTERFGHSVSISDDFARVGTEDYEGAYLFRRDGSTWLEQLRVTASDGEEMDFFGIAVDLDAAFGTAIIGANNDHITSGAVSGSEYIYSVLTLLAVEEESPVAPRKFDLGQNYPNPFNAATAIRYHLPAAGRVILTIYNVLGQRVKKLVSGLQSAGAYRIRWGGTDQDGTRVSSGVYLYRLETRSSTQVRKMVLLK